MSTVLATTYRMLRRLFGPKRDEVTGDWKRLHNEELYALYFFIKYCLGDQIKKEMGRVCSKYCREGRCIQSSRGETQE